MLASSERSIRFYTDLSRWLERARRAGVVRDMSVQQAIPNLMGLILFYPAVANDLPAERKGNPWGVALGRKTCEASEHIDEALS